MPATEVLVDGLDHPEGVAWDPAAGVLWAGGEAGQLYRVDVDRRTLEEAARAPGFVLGLAVDGRSRVVICCSGAGSLCVLDGGDEEMLRLDGTVPDGIAFTTDGGVVVSCYRPDRIVHIDAAGTVTTLAEDPQGTMLAAPTNIVFVGERLDRLVSANLGRWHLTLIDCALQGAPLHYPSNWAVDS